MINEAKEITELSKKNAELAKKLDTAKRKLDIQNNMLINRIETGKPLGTKHIDVKYAAKEVERIANEQKNIQSKLKSKSKG